MYKPTSAEDYIAHAPEHYQPGLIAMREILLDTDMEESIKWNIPVYGFGKKNVASLFYAKSYLGVWFMHGSLLADPDGLLINASPGKTVGQRQLRFGDSEEVDVALIRGFLAEAVSNQQDGLEFVATPRGPLEVPPELQRELEADPGLATAFAGFTPYKQREFCESISGVKRAETKARRVMKAIEMIRAGVGLTDKYRKK